SFLQLVDERLLLPPKQTPPEVDKQSCTSLLLDLLAQKGYTDGRGDIINIILLRKHSSRDRHFNPLKSKPKRQNQFGLPLGKNSCAYDPNPNSFDSPPNSYHPLHPTYETYSCDSCRNDSHFGYDCLPRFPLNYEPKPGYIQNYNSYPYDSPTFPQQYLCCENCEGPHENFLCQPINQNFYEPNLCYNSISFDFDQFQPPQFFVIHQPPQETSIQDMEDLKQQYLDEIKCLINSEYHDEIKINELKGNFNRMNIEINKKKKLQQLEQVANLSTYPSQRFNSFCYDDDDEDYIIAITPDFPITDSLTGFKSRPPMLNKENYVPWSSRLLRYAKSRPNEKLIHNSILNGPYVRRMIPEPGDANHDVNVTETFHEQTDDELSEKELKQIKADDQAIQTILFGLPEDIYVTVDSCETAQEIWLRV
nr:hypothetical protein [Tanacetum cinerariifolium]